MARTINRLTALQVERCRRGKLHDGGGLYFLGDQRAWAFRYGAQGRNWHGLGPLHTVGLAEAREKARQCRALLLDGASPLAVNRERLAAAKLAAQAPTFSECAETYCEAHRPSWRSSKHAGDWLRSLQAHAFPTIGALPITAIDTALLLKVLEPIWTTRTVTARRVRQRIEAVLDWSKARGLREGENPARLRGHLGHLLPQRKRTDRRHHAARQHHWCRPTCLAAFAEKAGGRHRRPLERDRPAREAVGRPPDPYEAGAGASRAPVRGRDRGPAASSGRAT